MAGLIDFNLLGQGVDYGQIARSYTDARARKTDNDLRKVQLERQTKLDARDDATYERDEKQRASFAAAVDPNTGQLDPDKARLAYAQSGDAKGLLEFEKSQAAAKKAQREGHLQELAGLAQLTSMAVDQPSYEKAVADAKAQGYDVSTLSPQFDPAQVEKMRYAVLDAKDRIEIELKQEEAKRKAADTEADNKRDQQRLGIEGARLGIDRQRLGLEGQRVAIAARDSRGGGSSGGVKAPSGYRFKANGELEPIPGGPAGGGAALTEAQGKGTGYYRVAAEAARTLNGIKGYNPSVVTQALDKGDVAGTTLSETDRRALNAQRAFVVAALRSESGATYGPSEVADKNRVLFPVSGDTPTVLADKARLRGEYLAALRSTAGPGVKGMAPVRGDAPAAATRQTARVSNDAEYNKLPSGTVFVGPDGKRRTKP